MPCSLLLFSRERRFQSYVHPKEKELSYISKRARDTLCRTKQGLKIVTSDSLRSGSNTASSPSVPEASVQTQVV